MIPVRQSTAFELAVGPVLDADGVAVTNCVVGDFKIKKTTGNFAALNGSATLTHVSAGVYDLVLTTSDVDTVGLATIAIDDTVNACASVHLQVMEEVIYDALYAASANTFTGAAGSTKVTGVVLTDTATTLTNLPAITSNWLTAAGIATGAITSAKFAAGAIDAAAIANSAIDAATFAADVDAEFLSYIVDDATRIDASALNTLSSHDPGETIMGATDLGTGSGLTSLATAAELAKVPKSDGTATWNATALASIQSEANDALAAYDPPTNAEMEARTLVAANYATAANLALVLADTGELQTDWVDGGRLDLILDARASQTSVDDLPTNAELTTALGTLNDISAADVWAVGTRTLTAGTNIQLPSNGLANVTAWTVDITGSLSGSVGSVTTKTGYELASTGLDLVLVAGVSVPEALRRIGAITAGEISGAGTGTETFLDWAESAASIVITVDSSGNRTSVVFN